MLKKLRQNTNTNRFKTKIYVDSFKLSSGSMKKLNEYLVKEEIKLILYSDEGVFSIENEKVFKLKPVDSPILREEFEGLILLFDDSHFEKESIFSQLPSEPLSQGFTRKYYSLNKTYNTLLQLVVDERNGVPFNHYFLLNDAYFFDNILVKKELNGFLSLLN
jgi:hypothetical protein